MITVAAHWRGTLVRWIDGKSANRPSRRPRNYSIQRDRQAEVQRIVREQKQRTVIEVLSSSALEQLRRGTCVELLIQKTHNIQVIITTKRGITRKLPEMFKSKKSDFWVFPLSHPHYRDLFPWDLYTRIIDNCTTTAPVPDPGQEEKDNVVRSWSRSFALHCSASGDLVFWSESLSGSI